MAGWSVSDKCLHKREVAASAVAGSAAMRVWYLPLGVVLKRVDKGIWWMPWH
jgi:hypothetical protein